MSDTDTNLWLYLPWLERDSNTATPMTWTSRDGSLVTSVYEGPVADGVNEESLVANVLYLVEAE